MKALFESKNLIGDGLYISPALRKWVINHQADGNLDITMLTINDHVTPLYRGMIRDWPSIEMNKFHVIFEEPTLTEEQEYDFRWKFDVGPAFQLCHKKRQHLARSYADLLGVTLSPAKGAIKPTYIPDYNAGNGLSVWEQYAELEGCVLISMFSMSCMSRDKNHPGLPPNKMLPWEKWPMLLQELRKSFPVSPIRLLGSPEDGIPLQLAALCADLGIEPMFGIPLNALAIVMQHAKLIVTIDNGMSHLAASQEAPTFLMYPTCLGTYYILPYNPNMTYAQMNPVSVHPDYLLQALQFSIKRSRR